MKKFTKYSLYINLALAVAVKVGILSSLDWWHF